MSEKYLQIGYKLPSSNNSLLNINTQETPFGGISSHFCEVGPSSNAFFNWILTSDKSITDVNNGFKDIVDASTKMVEAKNMLTSNNEIKATNNYELKTNIDSCSIIYSNDQYEGFRWYESKLSFSSNYNGDIHQDIQENYTIDGEGNLSIDIDGVTFSESSSKTFEDY